MTIRNNSETIKSALAAAKNHAEQEYASIQILGRELTAEELEKSAALSKCLEYIDEALKTIEQAV